MELLEFVYEIRRHVPIRAESVLHKLMKTYMVELF